MPIYKATPQDAEALTSLTLQSKAHWGYNAAQIALWQQQLTLTPAYIKTHIVYKLVVGDILTGYYSYFTDGDDVVLDNLFVLPGYIGKGYGRQLMEDFLLRVKKAGRLKIMLEADPNAEGFYAAFGFVTIRHLPTQTEGRFLLLMQLIL